MTNRRVSFLLNHLIGFLTLILFSRRSDSDKCHFTLSGSSTLVLFYHSHRFRQRLASVFTTHHSSLTNKTPREHFQRLLILLVRFLVPQLPHPKVPCLANHRCNKTYWRLTLRLSTNKKLYISSLQSNVSFLCEISFFFNNCGVDVRQVAVVTSRS